MAKVSEIVAEITAAAREQSSGIDQVNRAVAEMNKVTQQNAASAEESSSAATELTSQAQELTTTVSSFRLDGAARKPARASARVAAAPRPPRPKGSGVNGTVGTALPPRAAFPLEDDRDFQEF